MPKLLAGSTLHVVDVWALVTIGPGHRATWCAQALTRTWSNGVCTAAWGGIAASVVVGRLIIVAVSRMGTVVTAIAVEVINHWDILDKGGASIKPMYPQGCNIADTGHGVLMDTGSQAVEAEVWGKILVIKLFPIGGMAGRYCCKSGRRNESSSFLGDGNTGGTPAQT
jgi:hypothetical protein